MTQARGAGGLRTTLAEEVERQDGILKPMGVSLQALATDTALKECQGIV